MAKEILDLNENVATEGSDTPGQPQSIEDIIAAGAEAALENEPGPATPTVEIGTKTKRKYTRRKKADEPTPEELQAQRDLEVFFSPQGIGAVFTHGIDAFYRSCNADALTPEEQQMLASAFAAWTKARLPAGSSNYQPDLLLAASLFMTTLPRLQPIANTTAPWWRRFFSRFKRKPKLAVV